MPCRYSSRIHSCHGPCTKPLRATISVFGPICVWFVFRPLITRCFLSLISLFTLPLPPSLARLTSPGRGCTCLLPNQPRLQPRLEHVLFNILFCCTRLCALRLMTTNLRRRLLIEEEEEVPQRPTKKQKRNPSNLQKRLLDRQFRMSLFGNSKFNSHLPVPSFFGGKKRDAPRNENSVSSNVSDVDLDLELSFASNMSLNSPARDSQPLAPEENPNHVPMDISPAPARFEPVTTQQSSIPKPFMGRPRAATSAARLFGRDVSNGHDSSSPYPPLSISKSGTGTSNGKRLQRAALPTEWLAPSPAPADENSFSQVGGLKRVLQCLTTDIVMPASRHPLVSI